MPISIDAIAREIDPAAFDRLDTTDRHWRHRWESAIQAARRVAVLLEHPEGRTLPAEHISLKAPAADLKRALDYYRGLPTHGNGEILTTAIDTMLRALRQ